MSVTVVTAAVAEHATSEGTGIKQNLGAGEFALFTRRISSLNPRDCWLVFGSLAFFSMLIAGIFAMHGAWLILPFAGVEVLALWLTSRWIRRHAGDFEHVAISGDAVALEVCEKNRTQHVELNRAWARVVVQEQQGRMRVALRSHGREFEIGRYLDSGGKQALACEMRARLARH